MKATITSKDKTGKIASNRKENAFYEQYTVISVDKKTALPCEVIDARIYATKTRVYSCVWINCANTDTHISGGGYAGGYGYHKASAALSCALSDAGVKIDADISGAGESAMREAFGAIMQALGYENHYIFKAHA